MNQAQTVQAISSGLNVALEALAAVQAAMPILQQAQSENWTIDDARWAAPFQALDAALAKATARLT